MAMVASTLGVLTKVHGCKWPEHDAECRNSGAQPAEEPRGAGESFGQGEPEKQRRCCLQCGLKDSRVTPNRNRRAGTKGHVNGARAGLLLTLKERMVRKTYSLQTDTALQHCAGFQPHLPLSQVPLSRLQLV